MSIDLTILDDLPLFDDVARHEICAAGEMSVRHFADREKLLEHDGKRRVSFIVLDGEVRVEVKGVRVAQRQRREIVGEQAFIDGVAHSADVIASGDVRALEIPAATIDALLRNHVFARNLLSTLSCKLREATADRYVRYAQRERLFASFGQYVGRRHRDRLLEDEVDFGKPIFCRDAVVMFTDVRGFTATSSTMDPMELADDLGVYVSMIVDVVHEADGFVDAFIGDGTMSFWGYPGISPVAPERILEAAKRIVVASRALTLGGAPIRTGVGINVGELFMGNVGSDERRQYTVLGNTVNLAARFEGITKDFEADIVCSAEFFGKLPPEYRACFVEHPESAVRGAARAMALYALTIEDREERKED
jgi:class 3 adenylate cyclase